MKLKTTPTRQAKPTTKPNTNTKALSLLFAALLAILPAAKGHATAASPIKDKTNLDNALRGNPTMWYLKQIMKAQDDFKNIFETSLAQWQGARQSVQQIYEFAVNKEGADIFAIEEAMSTIEQLGEQLEELLNYAGVLGDLAKNIQEYDQDQLDDIAVNIGGIMANAYMIANQIQEMTSTALDQAIIVVNRIPREEVKGDINELMNA
jgi:hypothetical protein